MLPQTMMALTYSEGPKDPKRPSLNLALVRRPIPELKPNHVLIRMEAAACNPSDLAAIRGNYAVLPRDGEICGFEGAGRVVAADAGLMGRFLTGKRVAVVSQGGDGLWAEYACVPVSGCAPLPESLPSSAAAAYIVNPFTSHALIQIARRKRAKCIVLTAGASQVARGMIALGRRHGISSVAIVRKAELADELLQHGARDVVVQTDSGFDGALAAVLAAHQPSVLFDAVYGAHGARVFSAMPAGSQSIVYGFLDIDEASGDSLSAADLIFGEKSVGGFWLKTYVERLPLLSVLRISSTVRSLFETGVLSTRVAAVSDIEGFGDHIDAYAGDMSAGKRFVAFDGWRE